MSRYGKDRNYYDGYDREYRCYDRNVCLRELRRAYATDPDSQFVSNVWNFFKRTGYLTENQLGALRDLTFPKRKKEN